MNRFRFLGAAGLLLTLLVACSNGPTPPNTDPGTGPGSGTVFTDANAWTGGTGGARIITAAEFERQVNSGEIQLDTLDKRQARFDAAQAKTKANLAFLTAIPDAEKSPDVKALLAAQVELPTMPDGNYVLPVQQNDGSKVNVVTLGTPAMAALLVDTYKRADSVGNQLDAYRLGYEAAPEAIRANLPAPDGVAGQGMAAVLAARDALDTALAALDNLDGVKEEAGTSTASGLSAQAVRTDVGDQGTDCPRQPGGIYRNFSWPLKAFQSTIKQQGMRGTCWAFAAVAALESRDRVIFDQASNLSEQFLVNKVKREWGADDYNDGGGAEFTLNSAVDNNFLIPWEQYWPYNPAYGRPATAFQNDDPKTPVNEQVAGTMASYKGACGPGTSGADTLLYTWSCSETAHQSPFICAAAGNNNFCGYFTMTAPANASGSFADRTIGMWNNQWASLSANSRLKKFPLAELRSALASGYSLLASFGVFQGFDAASNGAATNGFVSDFSNMGARGGHVALFVGYIDNTTLHRRLPNAPTDQNGYFVLKNSWGCSGDGGYYYVPVDYVTQYFSDLSVLRLSSQRGEDWNRQQKTPDVQNSPDIQIKANPARVDLRVETDLAQFFKVTRPNVSSVTLNVTSDRDGALYSGPWSTDTGALFGSSLKYSFATPGTRTLTLVATNNGLDSTASFVVNVVNTPPTITLSSSGTPRLGEPYPITALITDINEATASVLCANTVWSVDAPDVPSSATGCAQTVRFGTTGSREVRVTTQDSDGATASQTLTLNVQPPPANPYPRIVSAGVYSRDYRPVPPGTVPISRCIDNAALGGQLIDLRQEGCTNGILTKPRHFARVVVENPQNEALTYDWKLYVTNRAGTSLLYGGTTASFDLYSPGGSEHPNNVVTDTCRIELTVGAPEASRSKSLTVWTGKCTYEFVGPN